MRAKYDRGASRFAIQIAMLWFMAGCDIRDFWGSVFLSDDGRNCIENPGCPVGQACDPVLKICKAVPDGGLSCTGADGGASCRPCDAPSDCPQSGACRLDRSIPDPGGVAVGSCIPPQQVCFVDADHCSEGKAQTFCTIELALGQCPYVVLRPRVSGPYPALTLAQGHVVVFGPGRDSAPVLAGVSAENLGTNLTLVDVVVEQSMGTGVQCSSGANVSLWRSVVQKSSIGIYADGCGQLDVERSRVSDNTNNGIDIGPGSTGYRIVNTLVVRNARDPEAQAAGVHIQISSGGRFLYNTVADNGHSTISGGVSCDVMTGQHVLLEQSIVSGNSQPGAGSQFAGACQLQGVAVGMDNIAGGNTAAVMLDPVTYYLTAASACCIDQSHDLSVGNDYVGTARPQGSVSDIGFFELPRSP